jgi:hypothetical protein
MTARSVVATGVCGDIFKHINESSRRDLLFCSLVLQVRMSQSMDNGPETTREKSSPPRGLVQILIIRAGLISVST